MTPSPLQDYTEDESRKKRRRRTTSCIGCQKAKCRCDFDIGAKSCRRCIALRIACSRGNESAAPKSALVSQTTIKALEERLEAQEQGLVETRMLLREMSQKLNALDSPKADENSRQPSPSRIQSSESMWKPADRSIGSAPVEVLRGLWRWQRDGQPHNSYFDDEDDHISPAILENETTEELIKTFLHYKHQLYFLDKTILMASGDGMPGASKFLHGACCLNALVYWERSFGTPLHVKIHKRVRSMLGQLILSPRLSLQDIQGILLMADYHFPPSGDGREYIDSWMLTGVAAKHAILTVSFSQIIKRIKEETATNEDHSAIRLWASICLHHFRWAATTGRPSTIPSAYIDQCNHILSFRDATMEDGMILAELTLFVTLLQRLGTRPSLDKDGECKDFDDWRKQWDHLLTLPTSSTLRIGFHIASLVLVVRSLGDLSQGLQSEDLLNQSLQHGHRIATGKLDKSSDHYYHKLLITSSTKYAALLLETFLNLPVALRDGMLANTCMCIGFSAFIVAFYDEPFSKLPDAVCLDLINRADEWCQTVAVKPGMGKFGQLAKQVLKNRLQGKGSHLIASNSLRCQAVDPTKFTSASQNLCRTSGETMEESPRIDNAWLGATPSIWSTLGMEDPEDPLNASLPVMEFIFNGGFGTYDETSHWH